ncbi:Uncharacterised protein [uncultured archaeon]|nr:Uncharacterised protein [uncultured archaeon]
MLTLTVPKSQRSFSKSKLYYVSSEENPDEKYIVIRVGGAGLYSSKYFCNCKDFFVRRLVDMVESTYTTEPCKHGRFVRDIEQSLPSGVEVVSAVRETIKTVPAR